MKYVKWFEEIGSGDVALVGGKNASLGEMIRNLQEKGVNVPSGFAITADAYEYVIEKAGIRNRIVDTLAGLDTYDMENLSTRGRKLREMIINASCPEDLEEEIRTAYRAMEQRYGENVDVAVRSSATAEDLPTASFAGQHETYLNVQGEDQLLEKVMECFASLFTDRAISYRASKGFDHLSVRLSVGVQKMVRSDLASAGVIFSVDPESGFENAVYITGAYGLGENVVQGIVNPDQFYVFKPLLKGDFKPIVEKKLGTKSKKLVYTEDGTEGRTEQKEVTKEDQMRFVLNDDEVLTLGRWACVIEDLYSMPMDIEWAKDGRTGELFIVQARPETVHSQRDITSFETYVLEEDRDSLREEGKLLIEGEAVGHKIGSGVVNIIEAASEIHKFEPGQVLVTTMTDPDWEPIMKIASAIVTDKGGRTCHAAIVSRELGIPCVVGTDHGTEVLNAVKEVTVDCSKGIGQIYEGKLKYRVEKQMTDILPRPRTRIMINASVPENAFVNAQIPNDGVGLARVEFIINSYIGIHPSALIDYEKLKRRAVKDEKIANVIEEIDKRSASYADKRQFFIDNLALGIAKIAAGFYPNEVIVRLSDFKTNEYANLIGGYLYEPEENNPMLGWRGASRYYDKKFKPAFGLECKAIKKVREEIGLTNVKVMVPFCRTPEEGRKVIATMAEFGLKRGNAEDKEKDKDEDRLEVYVMCEIPSNVVLADKFADVFDGFSIGSNDLTQLALGLDRDSDIIAHLFDEKNEAVKRLVQHVIVAAHQHEPRRKIGICGQAPSDFPDFAEFLVECGIDSISLNPDAVISTRIHVDEIEKQIRDRDRDRNRDRNRNRNRTGRRM
ncbi:MAG: phosphoenolpyruvate synthase [Methanophagales archaeon]|nr:phosphoenolpyruvate synthase [Methanophagales archaeon]